MAAASDDRWRMERVPTGIDNLDLVLDGGLTRGGLALIAGGPGVGKTVLAVQMAFHWAGQGRNVLWLVTLGEPNEKFLNNISEMAHYDPRQIGARIQLVNLSRYLRQGFEEQLAAIRETIHSEQYSFVVIDGFQGFRCFLTDPREVRLFLSELSAELALAGITLVVTLDTEMERYWESAEFTLSDAIIVLDRIHVEGREQRRLSVPKLRGRPAIGGYHTFRIDQRGIHLDPRLESVLVDAQGEENPPLIPFGVPGLDELLQGGVHEGSSTLIAGSVGTGKSMLASHFLAEAVRRSQPCLAVSTLDRLPGFLERADRFGLPLRRGYAQRLLTVRFRQPEQCDPDRFAWEVVRAVREQGLRRLVIDGIEPVERDLQPSGRALAYFMALTDHLQASGVTTLFTYELPDLTARATSLLASSIGRVVGNLILLRFVEAEGRLRRLMTVVKTRYSEHSAGFVEVLFRDGEMAIVPHAEEAARETLATARLGG